MKSNSKEKILKLSYSKFDKDWFKLQAFLEKKGNPLYEITDSINLKSDKIISLGNLTSVGGSLYLECINLESLGKLKAVGDNLTIERSNIKTLGNLSSVGKDLCVRNIFVNSIGRNSNIKSLGKLKTVGGKVSMCSSNIKTLGNLSSVGGLDAPNSKLESLGKLNFVENSLNLVNTPISKKYTKKDIRLSIKNWGGKYGNYIITHDYSLNDFYIKFGQYKGSRYRALPSSYKNWLIQQDWFEPERNMINGCYYGSFGPPKNNETSNNYEKNSDSYSKYAGYNGYSDNQIDDIFEGDPENSWNID
jgi:hypothetical protein